jgi:hypothetical protein
LIAAFEAVDVNSKVAKEKVEAMRAERDAFAERLRHVEAVTLQQDTSAVEELQVIINTTASFCGLFGRLAI